MKRMIRLLALALAALLLTGSLALAEIADCPTVETDVVEIKKYGNLVLGISGNALLEMGYEYGDIANFDIGGTVWAIPICSEYNDVDAGALVCRVYKADQAEDSTATLAINSGDLATTLGLAVQSKIEEDPGYRWDYAEGYADGIPVTISLNEKGGYATQIMLHQLQRSDVREDYPNLTDAEYANFRNVATTGMGANALYRSSSPVDPERNRNREADAAVNAAGIRTVMNMADNQATMEGYEDYANTYYSKLDVIPLNMVLDFNAESFRDALAEGFRFFATHEGPYLIHCTLGKDRAGFASAVLEALMGASADEIVADYMVSQYNFFGVTPDDERYEAIADSNIRKSLAHAFGIENIADPANDLAALAENYLREIGMGDDEITALKANLGTDIK